MSGPCCFNIHSNLFYSTDGFHVPILYFSICLPTCPKQAINYLILVPWLLESIPSSCMCVCVYKCIQCKLRLIIVLQKHMHRERERERVRESARGGSPNVQQFNIAVFGFSLDEDE